MLVTGDRGGPSRHAAASTIASKIKRARQTGVLHLAGMGLSTLPREAVHLHEQLDQDEKWWECVDITKLDVSHNALVEFPDDMGPLAWLVVLKADHNSVARLPESLASCALLKQLDVSDNPLVELPDALRALPSLVELRAANCRLSRVPAALAACAALEVLDLQGNQLGELPEGLFSRMPSLTALSLCRNSLSHLPRDLATLGGLRSLELHENRLATVPPLSRMQALVVVDLHQNRLEQLPLLPASSAVDRLFLGFNCLRTLDMAALLPLAPTLTVLDLRDNRLAELPPGIAHCTRLSTLDLSNNDIADLPATLGYVAPLRRLLLDGNPLRRIRHSLVAGPTEELKKYLRSRGPPIEELEPAGTAAAVPGAAAGAAPDWSNAAPRGAGYELLQAARQAAASGSLVLTDMALDALPALPELQQALPILRSADLSRNALRELPPALLSCPHLRSLVASHNRLEAPLTASLSAAAALEQLELVGCGLRAASFAPLHERALPLPRTLRVLNLQGNLLDDVPACVFSATALRELNLSHNRLSGAIDHLPWRALGALCSLNLGNNHITTVPADLAGLRSLAYLNLSNNDLAHIPPELGLLTELRALLIDGNPQRQIRPATIAGGTAAVLEALRHRLGIDATPQPGWGKPGALPQPSVNVGFRDARRDADRDGLAHAPRQLLDATAPEPPPASVPLPPQPAAPEDAPPDPADLARRIDQLQAEFDDFSTSRLRKVELRKELARLKAALNRVR